MNENVEKDVEKLIGNLEDMKKNFESSIDEIKTHARKRNWSELEKNLKECESKLDLCRSIISAILNLRKDLEENSKKSTN